MHFVFKKAKINGMTPGRCGCGCDHYHHVITKADKLPEIPEIKERRIADKKPRDPEWKPIHDAADGQKNTMASQITAAAEETKRNTNMSEMQAAIRTGDQNGISAAIPYNDYVEGLGKVEGTIQIAFDTAGAGMIIHLPPKYRGVKFDSTTPRAKKFIAEQGANLVKQIGNSTRDALRREIDKALKEGLGADVTAKNIRSLIGLTDKQAGAVTNFRRRMLEAGASMERSQKDATAYANRLLNHRAETIARTELMTAANQGHLEMIRQGVDQGLIPESVKRVWIVTPDDRLCEYCEPMEGQTTTLDGVFQSGLGSVDAPPLHPMCRCVTGIEFDR